ncbi:hypothetical protein FGG08_000003 [Glutinoglossum americanum]|uniref:Uncharacterized protein n=1 Tax=Glutinoglossum americanum TaxID=1670608 RepID=A0A9P8IAW7_9PEZI|nr:hypothetical protein FGG08_000003 [Glutinoglossum americanum]
MAEIDLPPFLANAWRFHQDDCLSEFRKFMTESQWTSSELSEAHLSNQVKAYKLRLEEQELSYRSHGRASAGTGAASLLSSSAAQLIELLQSSDNFLLDVETLAKNLNSPTLLVVLRDPRLPYIALRSFMNLPANYGPASAAEVARSNIDIDEAILANESYIRSRGVERNKDGVGLVRLSDAEVILGPSTVELDGDSQMLTRLIVRKDPPKGGFNFFDAKRPRLLRLQPSTEAFISTFHRITRGILEGLNWSNVFVAGGMILTTLLHVDPAKDDDKNVNDCDIDLYIYGLTPSEATEKVKEIYEVWARNLPPSGHQNLVIKNAKTITFLSDYPNRRIQVVLKSLASPTAALLNFDLDACAMGFDGTDVLMLPRCARALETGYSTFTMDLIWGHHLGDRRSTQDARVFKYANRGFGLRILPSYVKSLEIDYYLGPKRTMWGGPNKSNRKIERNEPGLKTLKRIACVAQDMVRRFYFGKTPLTEQPDWMDDENWNEIKEWDRHEVYRDDDGDDTMEDKEVPTIRISDLDSIKLHRNLPGGRQGVGDFEVWMRHHEAWVLDAIGKAEFVRQPPRSPSSNGVTRSTVYDGDYYDDLPEYQWDAAFDARLFSRSIDDHNDELFDRLKVEICSRVNIRYSATGWRDYLTRRIRRQVHGPDIQSVLEKQITIPIDISFKLEDYISSLVGPILEEKNIYNGNKDERRILIPVHEIGKGTTIIPDLVESAEKNLRYWVVGNELMWAGIDRVIDETTEVLWQIFHWNRLSRVDLESVLALACGFRRRIPPVLDLGPIPTPPTTARSDEEAGKSSSSTDAAGSTAVEAVKPPHILVKPTSSKTMGVLSEYEARVFQQWAFHVPPIISRTYTEPESSLYDEYEYTYPPPDKLFWRDGDEGSGEIEWVDVVPGGEPGNESHGGGLGGCVRSGRECVPE